VCLPTSALAAGVALVDAVNRPPVIGPPNFETFFVFENTQGFAATTMPAAVDPDGDALSYSIVNNFGGKVGVSLSTQYRCCCCCCCCCRCSCCFSQC
jgi:hypothetical protein